MKNISTIQLAISSWFFWKREYIGLLIDIYVSNKNIEERKTHKKFLVYLLIASLIFIIIRLFALKYIPYILLAILLSIIYLHKKQNSLLEDTEGFLNEEERFKGINCWFLENILITMLFMWLIITIFV